MRNLSDYKCIIIMTSIIMLVLLAARIIIVLNENNNKRTFSRNGEVNLIGDSQSFKC
jgi:hypothetical protein